MDRDLKRISLMIGEDQYEAITARGLNLSWLIRDLVDDYLKEHRIVLHVSAETMALYEKIASSTPLTDKEFEPFLREALHAYLKHQILKMQSLDQALAAEKKTE